MERVEPQLGEDTVRQGLPEAVPMMPEVVPGRRSEPLWVGFLLTELAMQWFFAGAALLGSLVGAVVSSAAQPDRWIAVGILFALSAYHGVTAWWGCRFDDRTPRVWAITFTQLFWRSASGCIFLTLSVLSAVHLQSSDLTAPLLAGSVAMLLLWLSVSLFRDRERFGVDRRAGWRTVRQKAGWVLIAGPLMELAPPLMLLQILA